MFQSRMVLRLTAAVLLAAAIISVVVLRIEYSSLQVERAELASSIAALGEEKERLRDSLNAEQTDEYIIEIAREKLNLRLPDEVIFYNDLTD